MTEEVLTGEETQTEETEIPAADIGIIVTADSEAEVVAPGKCIKQSVLIAGLRLKCLSSQIQTDQYIAENVCQSIGSPGKADIKIYL
jgi:exosome complex RNA-binding protein Csl4